MIRFFRSIFAWRTVRDTGVWRYSENAVTGRRKAVWGGYGYQPVDHGLLGVGDVIYGPRGREVIDSEFGTAARI